MLKHAPGSSVEVRLEYEPERVRVTVADTGPHGAHGVPPQRGPTPRSGVVNARDIAEILADVVVPAPIDPRRALPVLQ